MLNNRKVRLMSRLAMYEKDFGKEDIRLSKYYRTDYVRLNVLKTIVALTLGYLLIMLILVVYNSEYLLEHALSINYKDLIGKYAAVYVIVLTVYVALCMIGYMVKYRISRKKLAKYFRMLRKLRSMYREESGETGVDMQEMSGDEEEDNDDDDYQNT